MRDEPRLRSETVAVPEAPFDTVEFWAANACGSWLTRSSTRVTPATSMSSPVTWVTGLVVTRFACGIREPVTMTSSSSASCGVSCAMAGAEITNSAAPVSSVLANSLCRLLRFFKGRPFVVRCCCRHIGSRIDTRALMLTSILQRSHRVPRYSPITTGQQ